MKRIYFIIISVCIWALTACSGPGKSSDSVEATAAGEGNTEVHNEMTANIDGLELITVKRKPFTSIVKAGGMILTDSKDKTLITAKSSGIIKFSSHFLFPGVKTGKGQLLFTISGEDLAEDNTELSFLQIKSDLDEARANYERAQKLRPDRIITEEQFLSAKNDYEKVLNEYNNINGTFGKSGNHITSPDNGYLRDIFVTEGQKVRSGDPLATIVIQHKMVLKTFISPDRLGMLPTIEKANFTVSYTNKLYKTNELNGRNISYGKSTGENSYYIPVYFSMDYIPELIEGTFAEVYLIGNEIKDALTVPNTSLMEEFGRFYVFIRDEDGDFLKRYIKTGFDNGESTQVIEGLAENEQVVSSGAYQVKLSQMSSAAPAHSHNH